MSWDVRFMRRDEGVRIVNGALRTGWWWAIYGMRGR